MSTPAIFHRSTSAMWVPLPSPRDTNGALAPLIFCSAASVSVPPRDLRGVRFWSDQDEVVVHDGKALHAVTLGEKPLFGSPCVHEHHVGIAAAREVQRLARAERYDAHLDAALLLEERQDVLEEPGLFRGGRRCHDDEALRQCARRDAPMRAAGKRFVGSAPSVPWQFSFDERRCLRCRRLREEALDRRAFREPARVDEQDLVAESARLSRDCAWSSRSWFRSRGSGRRSFRPRAWRRDRGSRWARRGTAPRARAPRLGRARVSAARRPKGYARAVAPQRAAPRHRARRCARRSRFAASTPASLSP